MPEDTLPLEECEGLIADALVEIQGRVLQGQAEREHAGIVEAGNLGTLGVGSWS